jgi:hypothetical protein
MALRMEIAEMPLPITPRDPQRGRPSG